MIDHDRKILDAMENSGEWIIQHFSRRYIKATDSTRAIMRQSNTWRQYAALTAKEEAQ